MRDAAALGRFSSVFFCIALLGGCDGTSAPNADASTTESIRGNRYCEVLLAFLEGSSVEAQVWGTQGLNDCPAQDELQNSYSRYVVGG